MSISVHGLLKDAGGASRVTKLRRDSYANASPLPKPDDPIRNLADALHPYEMQFKCVSVKDASPTSKTFRFESTDGHIPVFQCGQYVNFRFKIGESTLSRPYSISSAPFSGRFFIIQFLVSRITFLGALYNHKAIFGEVTFFASYLPINSFIRFSR